MTTDDDMSIIRRGKGTSQVVRKGFAQGKEKLKASDRYLDGFCG